MKGVCDESKLVFFTILVEWLYHGTLKWFFVIICLLTLSILRSDFLYSVKFSIFMSNAASQRQIEL